MHKKRLITPFFIFLTTLTSLYVSALHARVHDFSTTRLKSSASAGVGALLTDESTVLNPAPLVFSRFSSMHLQTSGNRYLGPSERGITDNNARFDEEDGDKSVILSDIKSNIKGALSYHNQVESGDKRKRISGSAAHQLSKKSSTGIAYRYTIDSSPSVSGSEEITEKYHQIVFGVTHILSESVSVGMVVVDPLRVKEEDTKAIIGGEFIFSDILSLITDFGGDYNGNLSDTFLYRGAIQFRFFQDLFVRVGLFSDKGLQEKGNGMGVGWHGPKLAFEIAIKNSKPLEEATNSVAYGQEVKETAFSLSYHF